MKNQTLRILVSIASVVAVIIGCIALILAFIFLKHLMWTYQLRQESLISYHFDIRAVLGFALCLLIFLTTPVCGIVSFLYTNSFIKCDGGKARDIKKEAARIRKAQAEKERKKQLLEKLKSELGEE